MKERKLRVSQEILTGSYNPAFAQKVADHLGVELGETKLTRFANTEVKAEVPSVRGDQRVFVIQSHGAPVNESLMEQVAIVNAARRASARDVTAVVPPTAAMVVLIVQITLPSLIWDRSGCVCWRWPAPIVSSKFRPPCRTVRRLSQ